MLSLVAKSFHDRRIAICEAGTGVGKSLAYLLPALSAAKQGERVVISTATINLQHQLVEKDIPLALELLQSDLSFALIKGKGNYLCPARVEDQLNDFSLFEGNDQSSNAPDEANEENTLDQNTLKALLQWARKSDFGDRSDITIPITNQQWSEINAGGDACSPQRCRSRSDCFISRLRQQARNASVLIVNHHLLLSDLAIRMNGLGYKRDAILPPYAHIIIDEAHNIEQSATSLFSDTISRFSILRITRRLFRRSKKHKQRGLLPKLWHTYGISQNSRIERELSQVEMQMEQIEETALQLIGKKKTLRLLSSNPVDLYHELMLDMGAISAGIGVAASTLSTILSELSSEQREEPLATEISQLRRRLVEIDRMMRDFSTFEQQPERIFWLEQWQSRGRGKPNIAMMTSPIHVGGLLRSALYLPFSTVVFSSATLSIGGKFRYWREQVGLLINPTDSANSEEGSSQENTSAVADIAGSIIHEALDEQEDSKWNQEQEEEQKHPLIQLTEERVISAIFKAPFDYKNRVLFAVPTDAPLPNEPQFHAFATKFISEAITLTEGGALVLFTSYSMLNDVYEGCNPLLQQSNIITIRQGEGDRARLLDNFRSNHNSVLFATHSFWEGIDVPGESLRLLIIARLPFSVPNDPVSQARAELLEERGGHPFMDMALPAAIIRLRQGFGRLIRTANDRGAVIVLDTRLVKKNYGALFLQSLPEMRCYTVEHSSLIIALEKFFYN